MRNRIIAGLSDALLVVESDLKGGAIITANLAFDYNKDVFAVPGRIDDTYSRGTNYLIKSNIASLVDSASDICNAMNWGSTFRKEHSSLRCSLIWMKMKKLTDILKNSENDSLTIDEIHYLSGFTLGELSTILLNLEFKNVIENLPGSRYGLIKK